MNTDHFLQRWEDVIADRSRRVNEKHLLDETFDDTQDPARNEYHRDFDRLIFSSAFKRLQNKTQVFPLPGTAQVHNRLTHSLEVASVGRSLGTMVGKKIATLLLDNGKQFSQDVIDFYRYELKDVVLAACLAHDVGNPCFGHSGEKIISDYFSELKENLIASPRIKNRNKELQCITTEEWNDLLHFEGNANSLRMLTHEYFGKLSGGLRLTYLTLATTLKYPWDSTTIAKGKYGFFQEQRDLVEDIAGALNLFPKKQTSSSAFSRHPFVYLVEAADDISYTIMDMEDAQKIDILSTEEVRKYFWNLYREVNDKFSLEQDLNAVKEKEETIKNEREKIVYLRSKCINALTLATVEIFMDHHRQILEGSCNNLITLMIKEYGVESLQMIQKISIEKIYNHHTVTENMVGASHVLPELLDLFLPSILTPDTGEHTYQERKVFSLIDSQYRGNDFEEFNSLSPYRRILSLLDFLTGMTDAYIIEYYRKLKGIDSSRHYL